MSRGILEVYTIAHISQRIVGCSLSAALLGLGFYDLGLEVCGFGETL